MGTQVSVTLWTQNLNSISILFTLEFDLLPSFKFSCSKAHYIAIQAIRKAGRMFAGDISSEARVPTFYLHWFHGGLPGTISDFAVCFGAKQAKQNNDKIEQNKSTCFFFFQQHKWLIEGINDKYSLIYTSITERHKVENTITPEKKTIRLEEIKYPSPLYTDLPRPPIWFGSRTLKIFFGTISNDYHSCCV